MTQEQKRFFRDNPKFSPIGPPRKVKFSEWGTLHADGTYERLDHDPRKPITVGNGSIGVAVVDRLEPEK